MARRRPDWTTLHSNAVACIGRSLIADDITDFVTFRAVCRPWRSLSEDTKRRAECLPPRNWIMLSTPKQSPAKPVKFYNTSTHKSFSFDLTEYLGDGGGGYSLFHSFACLILLKNNGTQGFALLNPFMKSVTRLPSKIESDNPKAPSKIEDLINKISDVYVTSSSVIILRFSFLDYLVWTKPGDENWAYAKFNVSCLSNVLFYKDRILVVDPDKGVVQISFVDGMSSQPKLEVAIPDNSLDDARHIIDCNDKIFMVSFDPEDCEEQHFWESLEIYELDLDEEECFDVSKIGNCSIFLGDDRAISVSSKSGLVPANCIYFCDQYVDGETTWLNLTTNRLKFSSKKPFLRPNPLVKKLIKYCR